MKRGINFFEAFFIGLLIFKLHSEHYGITWWEVFLPLILAFIIMVFDFFNKVYNLTAHLQKFVLDKFIRFKMKQGARNTLKMIKKTNPGSWVNPDNLGK